MFENNEINVIRKKKVLQLVLKSKFSFPCNYFLKNTDEQEDKDDDLDHTRAAREIVLNKSL